MDKDTSRTKVNWKSVSQLNNKEKEKITKIMAVVNSVFMPSEDKKEKDRKNQMMAFYYRKGRKPPGNHPTNEQEVPESSTTGDAQVLPEEDA